MMMVMKMSSLLQTLGFAPDFVHAAVAPFINDIHRKGASVTSCLLHQRLAVKPNDIITHADVISWQVSVWSVMLEA